ncbi:MAG TPA: hypothetical protein VFO85_09960, partial [Vicinamibacteria bacterium]|nr:hypothetical protein [Vicinamibacteria bacterium]
MTFEVLRVALSATFAYLVLLALLRVSGKRTVAQGTAFDFVLALILGDMIDDLLWGEVPAAAFVVAVSTLTLAHTLVAGLKYVSPWFERVVAGADTVLLSHGQPVERGLRGEHVSEGELEELLRLRGVPRERWPEVELALLQESGEPTVSRTLAERPAARGDLIDGPRK